MFFQRSCLVLSGIKDRTRPGPLPFPEEASPFDHHTGPGALGSTRVRTGSRGWNPAPAMAYSANVSGTHCRIECTTNSPASVEPCILQRPGKHRAAKRLRQCGKSPSGQPQQSTSSQLKRPRNGDQKTEKKAREGEKKTAWAQGSSGGSRELQGVPWSQGRRHRQPMQMMKPRLLLACQEPPEYRAWYHHLILPPLMAAATPLCCHLAASLHRLSFQGY